MKDLSNTRQPSFLLMKVDDNGNKHWRFNYNVNVKVDEENINYFECNFVPEDGGIIAEEPSFELFINELMSIGLSDSDIENIRTNVQL